MLKFKSEPIADNTIIDQIILETASNAQGAPTISVNQFKGAVVVDPNLGNYVVIDFTVTDTTAMNIGRIRLMHGQTPVAISEDKQLLIVKEANKNLKIRLAAQFTGAEKCKFNTTSVNLPYATPFREGIVRFNNGDETNKSGTVYSAADVDAKIDSLTESLGNLDQYAKIHAVNTFTENNTFSQNVIVNGEISGDAVTAAGENGDKHIVNVGYADNKYLSKTEAGNTYLTQTNAADTYLTKQEAGTTYLKKTDAENAAANYAKLNVGNTFTGDVNTFKEVSATKFSGDGVSSDISADAENNGTKLPTCAAVATFVDSKTGTLVQTITTLQNKDNDLQSQIDGINAGQNLADIVNNTTELAAYDVSHLKAKGDYQHGTDSDMWDIGDKVQVLGGGDVQSSVYELVKGTKPNAESNSIQSTHNAAYYWRYIGVYGTNAYTKAEIDTELAKKVDKSSIDADTIPEQASGDKVPSTAAVKTYVDGKVGDINATLGNYVTLNTEQEITGAKTFANGNITIANPNDAHKAKHFVWVTASGDNTTLDYTSTIDHYDLTHNDTASDRFIRARNSDDVFYTSDLTRFNSENNAQFNTRLDQQIGTHYQYTTSDILITTSTHKIPDAQIGTPGNTGSTDDSLKENYVERIRLRKNTSTVDNIEGGFLSAGQSVTDIDLFADNINNVFNNEVSFRVCTPSGEGAKTDTSVLKIHSSGVYYHTQKGNSISTTEYQLRTAGSLDFETSINDAANDSHLPTSLAVKTYVATTVAAKINELQGGMSYLKLTSTEKQTVASNVDFNGTIGGTAVAEVAQSTEAGRKLVTVDYANEKLAQLASNNEFAGATNTFQEVSATKFSGDGVTPTQIAESVITDSGDKIVCLGFAENRYVKQNAISDKTKIGAMGLFLYTGGDSLKMGSDVSGSLLHTVGMQLPMDGVVSWSQGAAVITEGAETTWKLLNNTIAGEPCLVLAIRVG